MNGTSATVIPNLHGYGCLNSVLKLVNDNNCIDIVELHSPHGRIGYNLCSEFDEINVTSICKNWDHDPATIGNLTCVHDWSSNIVSNFEDGELDLVFIHDHDAPQDDLYSTLREWLKKIKPGGVMCGRHFGMETSHMSARAYALYEFARTESLVIDCVGGDTFVCYNTPLKETSGKAPIRMLPLND